MAIAELCGYLPLALRIVAAKLLEHPHWSVQQLLTRLADEKKRAAELEIDNIGITASMQLSFGSLSARASCLFLRLSLLGASDFAPWVCAPLIDEDFENASGLLDQLVTYRLVEPRRGADGHVRFRMHQLVRAFAMARLETTQSAEERTAALNRLLSCWLFLVTEAHNREWVRLF